MTDFKKLRDILYQNELWYGDTTRNVITGIDIDEIRSLDLIISFLRPEDKQLYLTIVFHEWPGNKVSNYFFTWYDNRPFEIARLDGNDLSQEECDHLCDILIKAGLKYTNNYQKEMIL